MNENERKQLTTLRDELSYLSTILSRTYWKRFDDDGNEVRTSLTDVVNQADKCKLLFPSGERLENNPYHDQLIRSGVATNILSEHLHSVVVEQIVDESTVYNTIMTVARWLDYYSKLKPLLDSLLEEEVQEVA